MASDTTSSSPKPKGKGRLRAVLLIALIPGLVGILLTYWPRAAALENTGLDFLFQLRRSLPQPQEVCVVAIDDDSYDAWDVDLLSAWPRGLHGELIRTLAQEGAIAAYELDLECRRPWAFPGPPRSGDDR